MAESSVPVTIMFIPSATVDRKDYHRKLVAALQRRLAALPTENQGKRNGWYGQFLVARDEDVPFITLAARLDRVPVYSVVALDDCVVDRLHLARAITQTLPDSTVILTGAGVQRPAAMPEQWQYQSIVQEPGNADAIIRQVFDFIVSQRQPSVTVH